MNTKSVFSLLKDAAINKPIYSITKFTTLDFPNHLASIFWFAKCNMACPYCYNPQIVREAGTLSEEEALNFLKTRQGRLEGVVLSGGECTLYPRLEQFCEAIKALGYKIKIDTNGSNPDRLKALISKDLIDYVALDYKAPKSSFTMLTHYRHFEHVEESLNLLIKSSIPFEVRTTLHSDLLTPNDINTIIQNLQEKGYSGTYYIQRYLHVDETLGNIKNPLNIFDENQILKIIPIQFRK